MKVIDCKHVATYCTLHVALDLHLHITTYCAASVNLSAWHLDKTEGKFLREKVCMYVRNT